MSEPDQPNLPDTEPVASSELSKDDLEQVAGGLSMNFDKLVFNDVKPPKGPITDGSSNT